MIRFHVGVSVDGYMAGPDQTADEPLGRGGEELHNWRFDPSLETEADREVMAAHLTGVGAGIMGRNMFAGPGPGDWDPDWRGWWGENPPYGCPVYVLTHHEREPLAMEGGTTFHFVTDGFDSALSSAREAAGDSDIQILGGGSVIQQALQANIVDRFQISVAPRVLGDGVRLFEGVDPRRFEIQRVIASPHVTHVTYTV